MLQFIERNIDLLCCPRCQEGLEVSGNGLVCSVCRISFKISGGIPLLYWPTEWNASKKDVTKKVRAFYEETPFPDYDEFSDVGSLIEKARQGVFAKLLDEQLPFGTRVLEVGCGTGQLTNFLSVANRTVVGTDISLSSLRLGQEFKLKNHLHQAHFLQMNLFRPIFRQGTFDLVICNGVLHHTADPFLAFKTISTLAKPNGYILVGLYHRYGRLITDARRWIFRLTGDRLQFLDPNLRKAQSSTAKKRAWFKDQYKHPHESKHTIGEAIGWLEQCGFEFVNSIPGTIAFRPFSPDEKLFASHQVGGGLDRFLTETGMALTGSRQGGFFIVIGKKKPPV